MNYKITLGILGMIIFIGLVTTMNIEIINSFESALVILVGITGASIFVDGIITEPSQKTEEKDGAR